MKKSAVLFLIFLIILIPTKVIAEELTEITPTCNKNDGCNKNCISGDPDCSCEVENGFVCKEDEACKGKLLQNWKNRVCCSIQCVKGTISDNNTKIEEFGSAKPKYEVVAAYQEETKKEKGKTAFYIIFALILIFLIALLIRDLLSKPKLTFPLKIQDNIKSIETKKEPSQLLKNIINSLTPDEVKAVNEIVNDEGINLEDLRNKIGFSKEKMAYCMIKLDRRQIIKSKGTINPRLFINEWLK